MKVVIGLSGGVDSAVSAKKLLADGYNVIGLFLDITEKGDNPELLSAKMLAEKLDIEFIVKNIHDELNEKICAYFVNSYLKGETPNPCILCNPEVKFAALLSTANEYGAEKIATGHYAGVEFSAEYNRYILKKGNTERDQSYMLYRLKQEALSRVVFPIGSAEKKIVRTMAAEISDEIANKPDSMEICFITDNNYIAYLEDYIAKKNIKIPEGNFVSLNGQIMGKHKGIHNYTIGQRKGFGINTNMPMFVKEIRPETNEVVLCAAGEEYANKIKIFGANWIMYDNPPKTFEADIKVRYSKTAQKGTVKILNENEAEIEFETAVRACTKGQSAVMYKNDYCIGGGFIQKIY